MSELFDTPAETTATPTTCDFFEDHAREVLRMPPEWKVYRWQVLRNHIDGQRLQEPIGYKVTGAVAPLKKDGYPNFKKRDKSTVREIILPFVAHKEWVQAWGRRTGKCTTCYGTAREWIGWNIETGTKYITCRACSGTGTFTTQA